MSGSDDLTLARKRTMMMGLIVGLLGLSVFALVVGGRALGLG